MNKHKYEAGSVNPLVVSSILLGLVAAGFAGAFIWAYGNYVDNKDNVSQKVDAAVTEARRVQLEQDQKKFVEQEKQPYRQLVGPDDLGRVTISYPKTWSVYIAKTGAAGYEAYLNPATVPTVNSNQPYAVRVIVSEQRYESTLAGYQSLVKKGDLTSSPITVNSFTGVRLDGKFSQTRSGSAVLFKVRDKTLMVASDAQSFRSDFDNIIVKSLDFNP